MPPRRRSALAVGAAFGAFMGIVFFTVLAVVELVSLLPSEYAWLGRRPFGWLENAAVAYSLALYALAGAIVGALVGASSFWFLSLRGRLIAARWGWAPVSAAGFLLLALAGGRFLNDWIFPPRSQFTFYIWNGLYTLTCLLFALLAGMGARAGAGLSIPRPSPRVGGLLRRVAVCLMVLGAYLGGSAALVAWTGARAESRLSGRSAQGRSTRAAASGDTERAGGEPAAGTEGRGAAPTAAGTSRPNVLLVVIETTRADHLSCYGYARRTTPNIDKWIAGQGALFENAIVQAPFSGPSKASIITGRYPHSHGVRDHPQLLRYDELTLAEHLRRQGYVTAGIGAGVWEDPKYGYSQGYDSFRSITAAYDRRSLRPFLTTFTLRLNTAAPWYTDPDERVPLLSAARAVDMAAKWMRSKHEAEEPFFMHLEINEPHAIYEPPPPFDTAFGPTGKGAEFMRDIKTKAVGTGQSRYDYESLNKDPDVLQQTIALYDGEIAYVDHELGRLFDAMSSAGYLNDTIVIVTADHGENFGEHGVYFCHAFLYDAAVRVPLLLRYPKDVPRGARVSRPVESIDIFPTVLELAGLPDEGLSLEGVSLMRPLRTGRGKRFAFTESRFYHPSLARYKHYRLSVPGVEGKWTSVRSDSLKLIRIPTLSGVQWELYDLAADPGETTNLAGEHRPEGVLRQALEAWTSGATARGQPANIRDKETLERLRSLGYID